jgi:hypothetical protein
MAFCRGCGAELTPGAALCASCGRPVETAAPSSAPSAPRPAGPAAAQGGFLRWLNEEPTGLAGAGLALLAGVLLSWIAWFPLSLPSRFIGVFIPAWTCTQYRVATPGMYLCSMTVALMTLAGPLAIMALLFVLRKPLAAALVFVLDRISPDLRFVMAPMVAMVLFLVAWSGIHYENANQVGLLPQWMFPVVVGLFAHGVARYGGFVQRLLGPVFDLRDRFPRILCYAAVFAVPFVFSFVITFQNRVSQETLKEQLTVLVALATGFVALAPRTGDITAGVQQLVWGRQGAAGDPGR